MEAPDPRVLRGLRALVWWAAAGVASMAITVAAYAVISSDAMANLVLNIGFAVALGLLGVAVVEIVVTMMLQWRWIMRQRRLRQTGALPEPQGPPTVSADPGRRIMRITMIVGVICSGIATVLWVIRLYFGM